MIGLLQVESSYWWLPLVSLTFLTYLPLQWVPTKWPHLSFAWVVKERFFLGLRVYIGALTCGKFFQILFLPWVRDVCYLKNYGYFVLLIHILIYLFNMVSLSTFHICVLRTSEAYICLFIKMTFARWIIWVVIIGKFIRNHGINQEL